MIFRKEHKAAKEMYLKFLKQGEKKATALHRAAGCFKHVTDRNLQAYIANS
jgi:hypothetical protein